jgi:outer membrane receptor for ferrienterochelin and colicin
MQKSPGRTNLNINTGFSAKDWDFSAKGFLGKANRSDQPFTEYVGDNENILDLSDGGSEIKTQHFNVGASNSNLSFRLIYDDYKTWYNYLNDSLDGYDGIYNEFRSILGEIKYDLRINDKLSLVPKINYKFSRPYYEKDYWRNFNNNRYSGTLLMNYLPGKNATVVAGTEWFSDKGHCINDSGYFYSNNEQNLIINNFSIFAEGTMRLKNINVIAGFRTENNSEYGWAVAPRFGLTGVFNKFHFKSLFSGAFRSPAIGNIDVSRDIEPEWSFITEIELGYRINNYMFVTANIFDIIINNSIIYYDNGGWTPGTDWGYTNANRAGSDGIEIEFKGMYSKGFVTANYSYYTQAYRPVHELYAVPGQGNRSLGLPGHKMGFLFNYMPLSSLSITPSIVIMGKKYGYNDVDGDDNPVIQAFDPGCLLNLAVTIENIMHKGLSITLSAQDILNQIPPYIQPYNGQFSPYPGRSREFLIKISMNTELFRH